MVGIIVKAMARMLVVVVVVHLGKSSWIFFVVEANVRRLALLEGAKQAEGRFLGSYAFCSSFKVAHLVRFLSLSSGWYRILLRNEKFQFDTQFVMEKGKKPNLRFMSALKILQMDFFPGP